MDVDPRLTVRGKVTHMTRLAKMSQALAQMEGTSWARLVGERRRDDPRLLGLMCRRIALGRARALGPSDVAHRHARPRELAQLRPHELLRPHVARLLLHPHDLGDLRVAPEQLGDLRGGERIEQLHPYYH